MQVFYDVDNLWFLKYSNKMLLAAGISRQGAHPGREHAAFPELRGQMQHQRTTGLQAWHYGNSTGHPNPAPLPVTTPLMARICNRAHLNTISRQNLFNHNI